MGKKSKRRPQTSGKPTPSRGGMRSVPTAIVSYTSESNFLPPTFARDAVPENGWAREFRYAEKELRHNPRNMDVIIRTAKAARVMRQFDRLSELMTKAESKGVAIEGDDNLALWQQLKEDNESSHRVSCIPSPKIQELLSNAMEEDADLDTINFGHELYSNLNCLQFAAAMGDIQFLERLVALGAALDYANDDLDDSLNRTSKTVKKPIGSTALLLAVVAACLSRQKLSSVGNVADESTLRDFYEGRVECAVQLGLGANLDVRLELPPGRDAKAALYKKMKDMRWVQKSVRELAPETGSELLVQIIESFDAGDSVNLVNCRCGSRMTWKKCHAGKEADCIFYQEKDDPKKILWRYSPLAKCPCGNTTKEYFKCCWEDAAFREHYKNDETAEMKITMRSTLKLDGREIGVEKFEQFKQIMGQLTAEEALKFTTDCIKTMGLPKIHPKSKSDTWDPIVYAGVVEQLDIDQFFQWNDVHWNIPKRELLKRVDEWNGALQNYCDKEGLDGPEREKVVTIHTASPFAPCANLNCDKVETKVKEFKTCSRCQFVGYCSHACLKENFQFHKDNCTKMGNR